MIAPPRWIDFLDHRFDLVFDRLVRMQPVAVGALEHHVVGRADRRGLGQQRRVPHPDVAGKTIRQGSPPLSTSRLTVAEPRMWPAGLYSMVMPGASSIFWKKPKASICCEHRFGVFDGVERLGGKMFGGAPLVVGRGFFFLQLARIAQDHAGERHTRFGRHDAAAEALLVGPRQEAGMVEMGVGQHDHVDVAGVDRQRLPVLKAQLLEALERGRSRSGS